MGEGPCGPPLCTTKKEAQLSYVARFPNGTSTPVEIKPWAGLNTPQEVHIYQRGSGLNWVGFSSTDVGTNQGFLIPPEGITFTGKGEPIWLAGEEDPEGETFVYILASDLFL